MTASSSDVAGGAVPGWLAPLASSLLDADRVDRVVAVRPGLGARQAAVLVLIGWGAEGPEILFVERATTLRTHAGQIALPGGAADPEDRDLVDTALREAVEETGVDRTSVAVLGSLPPAHLAVSGFDVTAVVSWWHTPGPVRAVDPGEVAALHLVAVAELVDPARRVSVQHPSGYTGPGFQVHGLLIWGLTAHLIDGVLGLAGWERPWDRTRVAAIPERYLTDRRAGALRTPTGPAGDAPDRATLPSPAPEPGGPNAH